MFLKFEDGRGTGAGEEWGEGIGEDGGLERSRMLPFAILSGGRVELALMLSEREVCIMQNGGCYRRLWVGTKAEASVGGEVGEISSRQEGDRIRGARVGHRGTDGRLLDSFLVFFLCCAQKRILARKSWLGGCFASCEETPTRTAYSNCRRIRHKAIVYLFALSGRLLCHHIASLVHTNDVV